jgi:hypothetical protein
MLRSQRNEQVSRRYQTELRTSVNLKAFGRVERANVREEVIASGARQRLHHRSFGRDRYTRKCGANMQKWSHRGIELSAGTSARQG